MGKDKPIVHIGVIGHVDHSKMSLTAAINQTLKMKKDKKPDESLDENRSHPIIIERYIPGEKPKDSCSRSIFIKRLISNKKPKFLKKK